MAVSRLVWFVAGLSLLVTMPAAAQSVTVGHVTGGLGNLKVPTASAGFDVVGPRGVSGGAATSASVWHTGIFGGERPWALLILSGRAGIHSVGQHVQKFVVAEVSLARGVSCCGIVGTGVNVGVNKWLDDRRALRFEGRLWVPRDAGVALFLVNVGMAFR